MSTLILVKSSGMLYGLLAFFILFSIEIAVFSFSSIFKSFWLLNIFYINITIFFSIIGTNISKIKKY